MSEAAERELTAEVIERLAATPDPRLRELMGALVTHLHAFARETRLTQDEWLAAIEFLTATGHMCDGERQEFVMLSDTLGLSSLVETIQAADGGGTGTAPTEATVLGPFYRPGAPLRDFGASIVISDVGGEPTVVSGRVLGPGGTPIPEATLDVWQTAPNRMYDTQDPGQPAFNLRGRFLTDELGRYRFITVRPVDYTVPDDGPVGELLHATGRHNWRAAHIHVIVSAPGHRSVTTHIFDAASRYLDSDTVFGVRPSLVRQFTPNHDPAAAAANGVRPPFLEVSFDFVLTPLPPD
ncbi:MAG TPA: dioxygenase [Thermopolyspora sp.]